MTVEAKLQRGIGKAFTKVQAKFNPSHRIFLLKRTSKSGAFTLIAELTTNALATYGDTRDALDLKIATTTANYDDVISQSTFIGYGVLDAENKVDVFEIDPDLSESAPTSGISPLWTLRAFRMDNDRYLVAAIDIYNGAVTNTDIYNGAVTNTDIYNGIVSGA